MRMKFRKPHRIKRKKSILKSRFFWLTILIFIFLGSFFYFLFFSSFFQVKNIFISGAEKTSSDEIKNFVQNKLEKKILFLKTKTIFLINLNQIKKEVLKNFPPVAEIEILRKFPNILNIILVERSPLANFCQDYNPPSPPFPSGGGQASHPQEKLRKNALQIKKEIEEEEKEMLEKEKFWEAPAFLRKLQPTRPKKV